MGAIGEYSEINIENFLSMQGELPFAVYIRLSDNKFTKIFHQGDIPDRSRFQTYAEKGVKELFIHKLERREYIAATERLVKKILATQPLTDEIAKTAVEELTEQTLFEIYEDRIFDEHSVRRAQTIVKAYVDTLKANPKSLASFLNLSRNETYPCRHGIATAVFSILLARAADNENDKTLNVVGLGGLLHDVGMSLIPKDIDDVNRKLTREEWAKVKQHPQLGVGMIQDMKGFPEEVKLIIAQHHERWDGSGYPLGLKGPAIFYPARIVAIADSFSALTTRRGGRALYNPEDALAMLTTEQGKFDSQLLKVFCGIFSKRSQAA